LYVKDLSFSTSSSLLNKEVLLSSPSESFSTDHTLGGENSYLPSKGSFLSIAQRRGSNIPPRMLLPSVNESSKVHKSLVRSQSFNLPDLDVKKNNSYNKSDNENSKKCLIADDDIISSAVEHQNEISSKEDHGIMLWNMMAELEVEEK